MTPTRDQLLQRSPGDIVVDQSRFPVVVMRFRGAPDADEFAAFFTTASALFDRTRAFVLVIDGREGGSLPFARIRDIGAWLKEEAPRIRAYLMGTAFVLPGPIQRGVLAAALAIAPVGAHEVFDEVEPAARWALDVMRRPIALGD